MTLEKRLNRLISVAFVDGHIICKVIRVFYSAMENTKAIIQVKNGTVSARRKYPEVQICQYIKRSIYATDNHQR